MLFRKNMNISLSFSLLIKLLDFHCNNYFHNNLSQVNFQSFPLSIEQLSHSIQLPLFNIIISSSIYHKFKEFERSSNPTSLENNQTHIYIFFHKYNFKIQTFTYLPLPISPIYSNQPIIRRGSNRLFDENFLLHLPDIIEKRGDLIYYTKPRFVAHILQPRMIHRDHDNIRLDG